MLDGRPSAEIKELSAAETLVLPLRSRRFSFSVLRVEDGARVAAGQLLATDPDNHDVPLLAPCAGTVSLTANAEHVTITVSGEADAAEPTDGNGGEGPGAELRGRLHACGAWPYVSDALTGRVPDPRKAPSAILVSVLSLEPFTARGDASLRGALPAFAKGLVALREAGGGARLSLVVPDAQAPLVNELREAVRGVDGLDIVPVPLRYPCDNAALLARGLGLGAGVWVLRTEGVLAVEAIVRTRAACTTRVVAVGGPAAVGPAHARVPLGYPLERLLAAFAAATSGIRVIRGGVLTGRQLEDDTAGVDVECTGLTLLPEPEERTFFEFARPGFAERSFSRSFLSALRPVFRERMTTDLRGEKRPCIACNFCDDICPAGVLPYQLHRYLRHDMLEEAEQAELELCVRCGLCSYVCPSKIELSQVLVEGQERVERELRAHRESKEKA